MVRLDALLNSWKTVREDTALAVEEFPAGELDFKPTPDLDSFRQVALHILNAGNGLSGVLLEGEKMMMGPEFREKTRKYIVKLPDGFDAPALAAELRRSLETPLAELSNKPADWYNEIITRVDGQQVTRMEMLQFVKEHELTHRAQLFMYLRLKGLVPSTTRRRLARQAGR
jgi:uncharacterized damage-inducible protein DinB